MTERLSLHFTSPVAKYGSEWMVGMSPLERGAHAALDPIQVLRGGRGAWMCTSSPRHGRGFTLHRSQGRWSIASSCLILPSSQGLWTQVPPQDPMPPLSYWLQSPLTLGAVLDGLSLSFQTTSCGCRSTWISGLPVRR